MPSKVSIGGGNFPGGPRDSRDDLGYGRATPKYHLKKALGGPTFPYWEESEGMDVDDVEMEDELIDDVRAVTTGPQGQDPLAKNAINPFYYVAGNTKLGEGTGVSLSPFPSMYKSKVQTSSGKRPVGRTARADASTMGPTINLGDPRGWSTMYDEEPDADEPIDNLEDLADKRIRECIRLILQGF